jgi:hypothetical protein
VRLFPQVLFSWPVRYKGYVLLYIGYQGIFILRMASSGLLRSVVIVRIDVSEERMAYISVITIGALGTTLAVTRNRITLLVMYC